jgi:hypothetical protein
MRFQLDNPLQAVLWIAIPVDAVIAAVLWLVLCH